MITALIICLGMSMPLWAGTPKAEDPTSGHSAYSKKLKAERLELIKDEAQLYLKIGNRQEAVRIADEIVSLNSESTEYLTEALFIFMQCGALDRAENILNILEKQSDQSVAYLENKAAFQLLKGRYAEAAELYAVLMKKVPGQIEYRTEYTRAVSALGSSREAYRMMSEIRLQKPQEFSVSDVMELTRDGADRFEIDFDHTMGPGGLQEIKVRSDFTFWLDDHYRMTVSSTHRYVTRDGRDGVDSVNDYVPGFTVKTGYVSGKYWYAGAGIGTEFYFDRSFISPEAYVGYDNTVYASKFSAEWNRLTDDPVEAVDRLGRNTRLLFSQNLDLKNGFSLRHELDVRFLTVDRYANIFNGDKDLGYRFSHLYGADYTLFKIPYTSVFYNYVSSRWEQPFEDIETIIPYLEEESRHTAGIYSEIELSKKLKLIGSIAHGRDRKRDVHLTVYSGSVEYAVNPENIIKCSYEYDYGDSGTLGAGNTTVITAAYARYF